jgi:hypothetical protein
MVARNALWFSPLAALLFFICTSAAAEGVPPYEHILVIIAENHACRQIIGSANIPTLVINHGARGLTDDTPYNHYSLLRTTEEALGINEYLSHANDSACGVKPMTSLFQLQ